MRKLQLEQVFLTDGGLETDMIFTRGVDLPCFAAITLLQSQAGRNELEAYYDRYIRIAQEAGSGFVLESASWRASRDWAPKIGLGEDELARLNRLCVEMLHELREKRRTPDFEILVSGCIGPRGDGYIPGAIMSVAEAQAYHSWQARHLAAAEPDMISAITMNNVNEAVGICLAAKAEEVPAIVSFTVETDGRLPTGDTLRQAIETVDQETGGYPSYYMINCAHPSHFAQELANGGVWARRIGGIRANASRCSHAELDAMSELDAGNPEELATDYAGLCRTLPQLKVLGGCCGTDERHVEAIARACLAPA